MTEEDVAALNLKPLRKRAMLALVIEARKQQQEAAVQRQSPASGATAASSPAVALSQPSSGSGWKRVPNAVRFELEPRGFDAETTTLLVEQLGFEKASVSARMSKHLQLVVCTGRASTPAVSPSPGLTLLCRNHAEPCMHPAHMP